MTDNKGTLDLWGIMDARGKVGPFRFRTSLRGRREGYAFYADEGMARALSLPGERVVRVRVEVLE